MIQLDSCDHCEKLVGKQANLQNKLNFSNQRDHYTDKIDGLGFAMIIPNLKGILGLRC